MFPGAMFQLLDIAYGGTQEPNNFSTVVHESTRLVTVQTTGIGTRQPSAELRVVQRKDLNERSTRVSVVTASLRHLFFALTCTATHFSLLHNEQTPADPTPYFTQPTSITYYSVSILSSNIYSP